MKLAPETLTILKNFASINNGLLIKKGSTLSTINRQECVVGRATVPDVFPREFAIFDLGRFLSVLSMFEGAPELDFEESHITISQGQTVLKYVYADPNLVSKAPNSMKMPSADITFKLSSATLAQVMKAVSVMGLPDISIVGDGKELSIEAVDLKNSTSDKFNIFLGDTESKFHFDFKPENFLMLADEYDVAISSKGLAEFKGARATYWIGLEQTSEFN